MRRTESPQPRLAREGFVPAGPEKRVHKRHMLIPKTGCPEDHIPTLMDFSEVLCPPERRALREIVETAEVVRENGHVYLVARVSSATLDSLATFETSRADLEARRVHRARGRSVTSAPGRRSYALCETDPGFGRGFSLSQIDICQSGAPTECPNNATEGRSLKRNQCSLWISLPWKSVLYGLVHER